MVIISAPSGAGKTTIVHKLLDARTDLEFSISACSRARRENEMEGKDYYFLTVEEFRKKIENNEFLEWQEVYEGNYYGTLKSEVSRITQKGSHIIFDVDPVGGLNIKKYGKENAISIFIVPPSLEILYERLKNRYTETEQEIQTRIDKAVSEIMLSMKFDHIVLNDNLPRAVSEAKKILKRFLSVKENN